MYRLKSMLRSYDAGYIIESQQKIYNPHCDFLFVCIFSNVQNCFLFYVFSLGILDNECLFNDAVSWISMSGRSHSLIIHIIEFL